MPLNNIGTDRQCRMRNEQVQCVIGLSFPLFSVFQGVGFMLPNSARAEC